MHDLLLFNCPVFIGFRNELKVKLKVWAEAVFIEVFVSIIFSF